jgi:hypothetical protein
MWFKKKVKPHELAAFILTTSSENIDQIERSVAGDIGMHPHHEPLRARLSDEAQWLAHVAGLIAVDTCASPSAGDAVRDVLIELFANIHSANMNVTALTPAFLTGLREKLSAYLGTYRQARAWNPDESADKREELALAHVALRFAEDIVQVSDSQLLGLALLKHYRAFFEERFRHFRIVA